MAGAALLLAASRPVRADWPTFRGDNARSGHASAGISDQPSVVWKAELGGSVDGPPVVAGGKVFVGTSSGVFAAVAADTGEVLWRTRLDGAICSAAAVAGERLVVGTSRRRVYCLSTQGKELWRVTAGDAVVASPLIVGERCVWGSMDGVLHAVNLSDGHLVWERKLSGGVSSAAAEAGGVVYVADEGGVVWAIRATDGEVLWKRETGCLGMAAPVVAGDLLLVPLVSPTRLAPPKVPYLMALARATGEVRWQVVQARSVFSSPLWTERGVVYVSVEGYLSETMLRCQSSDGGREVWKRRVGGVVDSSPALAGDRLYFGAHDGCLYVVEVKRGIPLSRVPLATKIFSSPALDNGRLYIGANDGCLYCLQ
ncbi:MAG: PQQ-binding-like beta-propeller repeat protein [Armatimonadetes bacterium]|nr:PQQ-binding-like beta-propeller repeat protein [Armatimonadota bacterium]